MKYLVVILLFITLWVFFICLVAYLSRRRTPLIDRSRHHAVTTLQALPAGTRQTGTCCLQVPCSAECAATHQRQRDLLQLDHGRVAAELRKAVQYANTTGDHETDAYGTDAYPADDFGADAYPIDQGH